jgi:hypothetical protein
LKVALGPVAARDAAKDRRQTVFDPYLPISAASFALSAFGLQNRDTTECGVIGFQFAN